MVFERITELRKSIRFYEERIKTWQKRVDKLRKELKEEEKCNGF